MRSFQGTPREYMMVLRAELERFNSDFIIEGLFGEYNKNIFGKYPKWIVKAINTKEEMEFIRGMGGVIVHVGFPGTGWYFDGAFDYIIDSVDNDGIIKKEVKKCLKTFGLV